MGWDFIAGATKNDLIAYRTKKQENDSTIWETLKSCVCGNVLWYVVKITNKKTGDSETMICCDLIQYSKNGWGYKGMCESEHPYYYSCPLEYLYMAPVANAKWRGNVILWHGEQKQKRERGYKHV